MGIQDFSGGGFYGKVGAHVGQRCYGQYMLRIYVKTPNPGTPAQKKVQTAFSIGVKFASFSCNLNNKSGTFSDPHNTQIAQRTKRAMQLQKQNALDLNQIPLFEESRNPDFVINSCQLYDFDNSLVKVKIAGNLPTTERHLSVCWYNSENEFSLDNCKISNGIFDPNGTDFNFTFPNIEDYEFSEKDKMIIVSNDDKTQSNTLVYMPSQNLLPIPIEEREINLQVQAFTRNGHNFTIIFEEDFINGVQEISAVNVRAVSAGSWTTKTLSNVEFYNSNGKFALTFSDGTSDNFGLFAFPANSSITFESILITSERLILTATNKTVSLTSNDLTRTIEQNMFELGSATFDNITFQGAVETPKWWCPEITDEWDYIFVDTKVTPVNQNDNRWKDTHNVIYTLVYPNGQNEFDTELDVDSVFSGSVAFYFYVEFPIDPDEVPEDVEFLTSQQDINIQISRTLNGVKYAYLSTIPQGTQYRIN